MNSSANILVIDNQKWQFDSIYGSLSRGNFEEFPGKTLDVFPDKSGYIEFIERVRINVNTKYPEQYIKESFQYILNCIETWKIDLIVMDYKLGAAYTCHTGVDLAMKINNEREENNKQLLPVIFFSKTEQNDLKRTSKNDQYNKRFPLTSKWVAKNYFGYEMFAESYIENQLVPAIMSMIKDNSIAILLDKIKAIITVQPSYEEQEEIKIALTSIRSGIEEHNEKIEFIPTKFIDYIISFASNNKQTEYWQRIDSQLIFEIAKIFKTEHT